MPRKPKVTVSVETIIPEVAKEMLDHNTHNRPQSWKKMIEYAAAITNGEWVLNGETIVIAPDGTILNGQHRLSAVVESNLAIETVVVRGIPKSAFPTLDQVKRRSIGDVLAINGEKNYCTLSGAIAWVYKLDDEYSGVNGTMRSPIALEVLDNNQGLRDSLNFILTNSVEKIMSGGMASALHYLMAKEDSTLADPFWEGIGTGAQLSKRSPALVLRAALFNNKNSDKKLSPRHICALCIKAWNVARKNKQCTTIRWKSDVESFPVIK